MRRRLALLPVALLLASCTAVHYQSPSFVERTHAHELVAVLPADVVFAGKMPAGLTDQQVMKIEEGESRAFQISLYRELLDRASAARMRYLCIDFQPVATTNRILEENDISIRGSWRMTSEELAEILEVDAVVRTRIEKTRYMSDLASFGIDLGAAIFDEVLPPRLGRTHDLTADASVFDGKTGDLLWKVVLDREAAWSRPPNEVIAGITRKLAKKFPYDCRL